MEFNNALALAYSATLSSTVASSRQVRTVLARTATDVSFPSQVGIVGEVSDHIRLVQPITVNFEYDAAGKIIVSDDVFYMYGEGVTREAALRDYISSLSEYYEVLESRKDAPSIKLFLYLQTYLRSIY